MSTRPLFRSHHADARHSGNRSREEIVLRLPFPRFQAPTQLGGLHRAGDARADQQPRLHIQHSPGQHGALRFVPGLHRDPPPRLGHHPAAVRQHGLHGLWVGVGSGADAKLRQVRQEDARHKEHPERARLLGE